MKYAAFVLFCLGLSGFVNAQERNIPPSANQLKVVKYESKKNTSKKPTDAESLPVHYKMYGTVRTASCGTYIEVTLNGATERYFPTNLNAKMHIDGYTILFDYVDDNTTKFPEGCDIKKSVQVNNVQYNTGD